jgi:pyruvate kinase
LGLSEIFELLNKIDGLAAMISVEGEAAMASWRDWPIPPEFADSAANLAHYLALRRRDLRPLQPHLMALGLSSLGRCEARVVPALRAVGATLGALNGDPDRPRPGFEEFFAGEKALARRAQAIFGSRSRGRAAALLVTCPSEAAGDPKFMLQLAERGVEAVRINCAHDDANAWGRMIRHVRAAESATGRRMKILMDLAGPKIRTGAVRAGKGKQRIFPGDVLAITAPGKLGKLKHSDANFGVECTLPEAIQHAEAGRKIFIDDGKVSAVVLGVEEWGVLARVTAAPEKGMKLKPEKGLNFPGIDLGVAAMTDKDFADLDFVAQHCDGISFSFVHCAEDVAMLQDALAQRRPDDWQTLSLILKIETRQAVDNLPEIVVRAAGRQPAAIMIARGDLALEIGFARTAEMQEEILWIGEAAHIPVIWATQVLEHLVREGAPIRGEMTDAAMAARAECVMLNKGPYLLEAIDTLDSLLMRMGEHQHKKTPQLRRLMSW